MKRIIIISLSLLYICSSYLNAQKQMNWWHFGNNSGINFNDTQTVNGIPDLPKPIQGFISTREGCFTLSDSNGNLLMASDGITVYNKNGGIMPNGTGLKGHDSATQSGIVIPMPGNPKKYYIVTVDAVESDINGLNYSIVDMSQNNGLGDVISKNNVLKAGRVAENIAAVRHNNGKDYWLIHRAGKDFLVWAITPSGFSGSPIVYDAIIDLPFHNVQTHGWLGELRFDASGTKFVHVDCAQNSYITMGNFNPSTGVISNVQYARGYSNLYGAEFSALGEYVYISEYSGTLRCIKYDDFMNGQTSLNNMSIPVSNIKLGPDKRIYGFREGSCDMYVILNPEDGGTDIKMFPNYLTHSARLGLPVFSASWLNVSLDGDNIFCLNTNKSFDITIETNGSLPKEPKYTVWDFGDGSAPTSLDATNVPGTQSKTHTYDRPGKYTITVKVYDENEDEITEMIQTFEVDVKACVLPVNPNIHLSSTN